jgi:4-hydroxy-tetrahydrodipicolinate synthase
MFRGIITPMITPFNKNYEIDFVGVEWLINHLVRGGVDGVFPNSTTGESVSLSLDEKKKLIGRVVELVNGRTKVLPGIGGNTTLEVLELGKFARDVGVDGGIIITPYFFKPTPEELKKHYGKIAESLDMPLFIYHFPALTGVSLPVQTVKELAREYSNIAGIKITHDSLIYLKQVVWEVKEVRKDFSVFSGLDQYFLINLMIGGDGGVVALSNLAPKLHRSIYDAWLSGDIAKSYSLYMKLLKLSKLIESGTSTIAAIKAALASVGAPIEPVLRPPLSEEKKEPERELLKEFMNYIF